MSPVAALRRVAGALQLTAEERRSLIALARPDLASIETPVADAFSGLGTQVAALRDLARRCTHVSSLAEIAEAATRAVHALAGATSLAYMREHDADAGDLSVVGVCSRNGEALVGHRQSCASVAYAMPHFREGRPFAETDLRDSPCLELRTRVERVGVYAYYSHPILRRTDVDFVLGIALREARLPAPWQIAGLEAAAAIVELTIRR